MGARDIKMEAIKRRNMQGYVHQYPYKNFTSSYNLVNFFLYENERGELPPSV